MSGEKRLLGFCRRNGLKEGGESASYMSLRLLTRRGPDLDKNSHR